MSAPFPRTQFLGAPIDKCPLIIAGSLLMLSRRFFATSVLASSAGLAVAGTSLAKTQPHSAQKGAATGHTSPHVHFKTIEVAGVSIAYREAGPVGAPVVLMLHGWPSSGAMFRDLIRELSSKYHVFAPDYPGFGNSAIPDNARFKYTFDSLGDIIGQFIDQVGIKQYALYATDFGGLVGYRMMLKSPGRLEALIAQNNPLFFAESPWFGPIVPYWQTGTAESRQKAAEHYLTAAVVRDLYTTGVSDPSLVDPEQWQSEYAMLLRPGAADASLDLLYDIRTNGPVLQAAQNYLKVQQPPTLVVSGKHDILFAGENQQRYREVLPKAEFHLLDSGHCALADKSDEIASLAHQFLARVI
jgi:pimeloyl-ACP methyl ester carboxylesterase